MTDPGGWYTGRSGREPAVSDPLHCNNFTVETRNSKRLCEFEEICKRLREFEEIKISQGKSVEGM